MTYWSDVRGVLKTHFHAVCVRESARVRVSLAGAYMHVCAPVSDLEGAGGECLRACVRVHVRWGARKRRARARVCVEVVCVHLGGVCAHARFVGLRAWLSH